MAINDRRIGTQVYGGKAPTAYNVYTPPKKTNAQRRLEERRIATQVYGGKAPQLYEGAPEYKVAKFGDGSGFPAGTARDSGSDEIRIEPPPTKYMQPDIASGEPGEYGIEYYNESGATGINPPTFSEYLGTIGTPDYNIPNFTGFHGEEGYVNPWWQNELFKGITTDEDLYAANEAMRTATGSYDARRIYEGGTSYIPTGVAAQEQRAAQKERDKGKYYQEGMFEMPGMALYNRWEQDAQGNWNDRGKENYFDDLYELNGVDPTDKAMVEAFWSYADDDLLMMGEFFDVIEWPSGGGGYGGYGAMPTPYRQYTQGGQRPQARGDYASYLSLTSWSI